MQGFTISVFNRSYEKTELAVTRAKKEGSDFSPSMFLTCGATITKDKSHFSVRRARQQVEGIQGSQRLRAIFEEAQVFQAFQQKTLESRSDQQPSSQSRNAGHVPIALTLIVDLKLITWYCCAGESFYL
jgi:hypothetical protein